MATSPRIVALCAVGWIVLLLVAGSRVGANDVRHRIGSCVDSLVASSVARLVSGAATPRADLANGGKQVVFEGVDNRA